MMSKTVLSGVALSGVALLLIFFIFNRNQNSFAGRYQASDSLNPLAAVPKDHKGQNRSASSGVVTFSAGLDNEYYQVNKKNRKVHLYLETKLAGFVNEKAHRLPLNLSLVIDRSGSMAGEKIAFARQAAKKIIDQLQPQDRVSIVIYDQDVELLLPSVMAVDKAAIQNTIDDITDRGGTNLWGGTEKGYEQVKAHYRPDHVNRVLLISDGLANEGLTDEGAIKHKVQQFKDKDGITLSSFGVGLDYNEGLMTGMAETGSGNYYFIDQPDKMAGIFEKELNGLLKVAAQNARLTVQLPKGVRLEKVYAFPYEQQGDLVTIHFRDLFSDETKGVLLRFALNNGLQTAVIFHSQLHFADVSDGQTKSIAHDNILSPVQDEEQYLVHFNRPVMEQMVLFTANEQMEQAMKEADRGEYESARKLIRSNASYLKAHEDYLESSPELKKMDSTNHTYATMLIDAENKSVNEVKKMQKENKVESYKVRSKKQ